MYNYIKKRRDNMRSNYTGKLYQDYEHLQQKYDSQAKELHHMKLRADIAEDEQHRLKKNDSKKRICHKGKK